VNKTIHSQQSERVREALVKLRQNAQLTQRQLARKLRREHSLISRLELGERRVDVVEFFWICQACGADPARTASSLMRQFAKMQAESPGSQGEPGNAEGRMQNEECRMKKAGEATTQEMQKAE